TPSVRDPFVAQEEMVKALAEAARVRVTSVNNAEAFFAEHPDAVVPMPDGAEIFETTGPWEDFSTPSRDLRLLIAIDVVRGFPARALRRPERYATPKSSKDIASDLQRILDRELAARKITYT